MANDDQQNNPGIKYTFSDPNTGSSQVIYAPRDLTSSEMEELGGKLFPGSSNDTFGQSGQIGSGVSHATQEPPQSLTVPSAFVGPLSNLGVPFDPSTMKTAQTQAAQQAAYQAKADAYQKAQFAHTSVLGPSDGGLAGYLGTQPPTINFTPAPLPPPPLGQMASSLPLNLTPPQHGFSVTQPTEGDALSNLRNFQTTPLIENGKSQHYDLTDPSRWTQPDPLTQKLQGLNFDPASFASAVIGGHRTVGMKGGEDTASTKIAAQEIASSLGLPDYKQLMDRHSPVFKAFEKTYVSSMGQTPDTLQGSLNQAGYGQSSDPYASFLGSVIKDNPNIANYSGFDLAMLALNNAMPGQYVKTIGQILAGNNQSNLERQESNPFLNGISNVGSMVGDLAGFMGAGKIAEAFAPTAESTVASGLNGDIVGALTKTAPSSAAKEGLKLAGEQAAFQVPSVFTNARERYETAKDNGKDLSYQDALLQSAGEGAKQFASIFNPLTYLDPNTSWDQKVTDGLMGSLMLFGAYQHFVVPNNVKVLAYRLFPEFRGEDVPNESLKAAATAQSVLESLPPSEMRANAYTAFRQNVTENPQKLGLDSDFFTNKKPVPKGYMDQASQNVAEAVNLIRMGAVPEEVIAKGKGQYGEAWANAVQGQLNLDEQANIFKALGTDTALPQNQKYLSAARTKFLAALYQHAGDLVAADKAKDSPTAAHITDIAPPSDPEAEQRAQQVLSTAVSTQIGNAEPGALPTQMELFPQETAPPQVAPMAPTLPAETPAPAEATQYAQPPIESLTEQPPVTVTSPEVSASAENPPVTENQETTPETINANPPEVARGKQAALDFFDKNKETLGLDDGTHARVRALINSIPSNMLESLGFSVQDMHGANGAFLGDHDLIALSSRLHEAAPEEIHRVIAEEIGHFMQTMVPDYVREFSEAEFARQRDEGTLPPELANYPSDQRYSEWFARQYAELAIARTEPPASWLASIQRTFQDWIDGLKNMFLGDKQYSKVYNIIRDLEGGKFDGRAPVKEKGVINLSIKNGDSEFDPDILRAAKIIRMMPLDSDDPKAFQEAADAIGFEIPEGRLDEIFNAAKSHIGDGPTYDRGRATQENNEQHSPMQDVTEFNNSTKAAIGRVRNAFAIDPFEKQTTTWEDARLLASGQYSLENADKITDQVMAVDPSQDSANHLILNRAAEESREKVNAIDQAIAAHNSRFKGNTDSPDYRATLAHLQAERDGSLANLERYSDALNTIGSNRGRGLQGLNIVTDDRFITPDERIEKAQAQKGDIPLTEDEKKTITRDGVNEDRARTRVSIAIAKDIVEKELAETDESNKVFDLLQDYRDVLKGFERKLSGTMTDEEVSALRYEFKQVKAELDKGKTLIDATTRALEGEVLTGKKSPLEILAKLRGEEEGKEPTAKPGYASPEVRKIREAFNRYQEHLATEYAEEAKNPTPKPPVDYNAKLNAVELKIKQAYKDIAAGETGAEKDASKPQPASLAAAKAKLAILETQKALLQKIKDLTTLHDEGGQLSSPKKPAVTDPDGMMNQHLGEQVRRLEYKLKLNERLEDLHNQIANEEKRIAGGDWLNKQPEKSGKTPYRSPSEVAAGEKLKTLKERYRLLSEISDAQNDLDNNVERTAKAKSPAGDEINNNLRTRLSNLVAQLTYEDRTKLRLEGRIAKAQADADKLDRGTWTPTNPADRSKNSPAIKKLRDELDAVRYANAKKIAALAPMSFVEKLRYALDANQKATLSARGYEFGTNFAGVALEGGPLMNNADKFASLFMKNKPSSVDWQSPFTRAAYGQYAVGFRNFGRDIASTFSDAKRPGGAGQMRNADTPFKQKLYTAINVIRNSPQFSHAGSEGVYREMFLRNIINSVVKTEQKQALAKGVDYNRASAYQSYYDNLDGSGDEMHGLANREALVHSLTIGSGNPLESALGDWSDPRFWQAKGWTGNAAHMVPLLSELVARYAKFFAKFANIATDYTPLGFAKASAKTISAKNLGTIDDEYTRLSIARTIARGAVGTGLIAASYMAVKQNPTLARYDKETNSVVFAGPSGYLFKLMGPYAMPFTLGAALATMDDTKLSGANKWDIAIKAAQDAAGLNQPIVSGPKRVLEAVTGQGASGWKKVEKVVGATLANNLVPAQFKQLSRDWDEVMNGVYTRRTDANDFLGTVANSFKSDIPGLRTQLPITLAGVRYPGLSEQTQQAFKELKYGPKDLKFTQQHSYQGFTQQEWNSYIPSAQERVAQIANRLTQTPEFKALPATKADVTSKSNISNRYDQLGAAINSGMSLETFGTKIGLGSDIKDVLSQYLVNVNKPAEFKASATTGENPGQYQWRMNAMREAITENVNKQIAKNGFTGLPFATQNKLLQDQVNAAVSKINSGAKGIEGSSNDTARGAAATKAQKESELSRIRSNEVPSDTLSRLLSTFPR